MVLPATLAVPLHESAQTALAGWIGEPSLQATGPGKPVETADHYSKVEQHNNKELPSARTDVNGFQEIITCNG